MHRDTITILLVEDDSIDAEWVGRALRRYAPGAELEVEIDGDDAMRRLRGEDGPALQPDVLLLDLHLPRVSGFEVLGELRRDPRLRDLPVVVLSTSADPQDRATAEHHGISGYLTKGSDRDGRALTELLRRAVAADPRPWLLLVEDDAIDRENIRRLVGDRYRLVEAQTGGEALALLDRRRFDAVLLDFRLPDCDADDLLRTLGDEGSGGPRLPVVVLTGHDSLALASSSAGADDILSKRHLAADTLHRRIEAARERCRLRTELIRQRDAFRAFAIQAAHDLRSPLRRIEQFSKLLLGDHADALDAEGKRWLGFIAENSAQLDHLVERLLDYAAAGSQAQKRDEVDLAALTSEILTAYEDEIATSGAVVDVGPLPTVRGDRPRLRQVVQNLLQNALRYHPGSPRIAVSATFCGDEWLIEVADDGPGVRPDLRERIFEPLFSHQTERGRRGVGLGLAVAATVVAQHGGRIWVSSEPGAGARFRFTLPVTPS